MIYGLIISLGVFLLADIGFYSQNNPEIIELFILLSISAVFYLLPYFYSISTLLKSESIIRDLVKDINFLDYFEDIYSNTKNPFQSALDITNNALRNNDNETSRLGIQKIGQKSEEILTEMSGLRGEIGQGVRLKKRGVLISRETIFSLTGTQILKNIKELGVTAVENKNIESAKDVVKSLHNLGKILVENFPVTISSLVSVHLNLLIIEKTSRIPGKMSVMLLEGDVLASIVRLSKMFVDLYQQDKEIMLGFFDFFVREMQEKTDLQCIRKVDAKTIAEEPKKIIVVVENCEKEIKERYNIVYS